MNLKEKVPAKELVEDKFACMHIFKARKAMLCITDADVDTLHKFKIHLEFNQSCPHPHQLAGLNHHQPCAGLLLPCPPNWSPCSAHVLPGIYSKQWPGWFC